MIFLPARVVSVGRPASPTRAANVCGLPAAGTRAGAGAAEDARAEAEEEEEEEEACKSPGVCPSAASIEIVNPGPTEQFRSASIRAEAPPT